MTYDYYTGWRLILLNFAIGLGTFVQILDTTIANVAIPYIAGNLSVSADQGTWVITSFAASNAIVLPLTGWLADHFGRVRLFVWSVLLFGLVSFLCGLSTSLPMLVFLRVIQGAVAGSLIPLSQSLIVASNPPEKQGVALGFWAMIVVVAPVLGPIVGGYLTEVYSWPWIFYVNVPICIFSGLIVWYFLKAHESKIKRVPIDWVGLVLLAVGVGALQIMLDKGKDLDWFESNIIILLTILSTVSLLYFAIWTYYQEHPIVDFSFFKNRNYALSVTMLSIGFLLYFASVVTIPLWLQTEQMYTAYWAGIAVAPIGIPPLFLATSVGKYAQRFDPRYFALGSFIIFSLAFFYQANFTTVISLKHIMISRLLIGLGLSFFFLPLIQLSSADIPSDRYASAAGVMNFIRILIGSGFGTSLSIEMWTRLEIFHHARLAESITSYRPQVTQFYQSLEQRGAQFTSDVVTNLMDQQVEQQAFILSTNDLSWLSAWLFLALIPLIFFCKSVKTKDIVAVSH